MFVLIGLFGTIFILKGIENIRTGKAEETGVRRLVNMALGQSNTYEGDAAKLLGGISIAGGVLLNIVGIVVLIWGPIRA